MTVTDVLVYLWIGRLTSTGSSFVEEGNESRAVGKNTTDFTVVNSFLQDVGTVDQTRPAVDEITMETVTARITLSKDPGGNVVVVRELLDIVDDLVEEHRQVDWVG